jgi:hypothetical protein
VPADDASLVNPEDHEWEFEGSIPSEPPFEGEESEYEIEEEEIVQVEDEELSDPGLDIRTSERKQIREIFT